MHTLQHPKTTRPPAALSRDAPTLLLQVTMSPTAANRARQAAITYFRGARSANSRYLAYKEVPRANAPKTARACSAP